MKKIETSESSQAGFTIVEVVMAFFVLTMAMAIVLSTQIYAMREASGDSLHAQYIDYARAAEQVLVNIIQAQTAIGVSTNGLEAYGMDYARAFTIRFIDEDDDPTTVENNRLVIDPDVSIDGDESVVCEYVSPLETEEMFRVISTSPTSAVIMFHVGELAPENKKARLGRNYHGVEVRLSATPRNSAMFRK
jgi:type II secretory pathway pseudopilin PulG